VKEAARLLRDGEQTTVDSIARAAGVSRATFYRNFPSRSELLSELRLEPAIDTRRRVLEAASTMLQRQSLGELSMDGLAEAAGVSRANLYRLFPGKSALFSAMLVAFTPFQPVMRLLEERGNEPPETLIPDLAATAYLAVAPHAGLARTLILEVSSRSAETQDAFADTGLLAMMRVATYLQRQMDAGRLRLMPPMLALQGLVGAVMLHVLATPLLAAVGAPVPSGEQAVRGLAKVWLEGMRPR
jgi:AcrR family transcriptional regulator